MFNKNKFNILITISILILFLVLLYNFNDYTKAVRNNRESDDKIVEKYCKDGYQGTEREEFCEVALHKEKSETDFFTTFANVLVFGGVTDGIGFRNLSYVIILFVIVPALYYVCRYLKSNAITNESTRHKYQRNILRLFLNAYKPAFILPLIGIIAIVFCYCYSPHFNSLSDVGWSSKTLSNPCLFMVLYVLNLLIHGVLFINISLCVSRKYHNYFVALILSFLSYLAIEVVLEVVFGGIIISSVLHMGSLMSMFNIMAMFTFNDSNGIFSCMIVPFVLMLISFVIVLKLYSNKEKLIIDCEKNIEEEAV